MSESNGHRVVDFDALRAARREKLGPAPTFRFAGKDHELPLEMPAEYCFAWSEARYATAIGVMVGDDAATAFLKWAAIDEIWAFAREIDAAYGIGQGEAPASDAS